MPIREHRQRTLGNRLTALPGVHDLRLFLFKKKARTSHGADILAVARTHLTPLTSWWHRQSTTVLRVVCFLS
jgi:hypothetical protein